MKVKNILPRRKKAGGKSTPSSPLGGTTSPVAAAAVPRGNRDDEFASGAPAAHESGASVGADGEDGAGAGADGGVPAGEGPRRQVRKAVAVAGDGAGAGAGAAAEYPETPVGKMSLGDRTTETADVTLIEGSGGGGPGMDDDSGVGHIELKLTETDDGTDGQDAVRANKAIDKAMHPPSRPAAQCRTPGRDATEEGAARQQHRQTRSVGSSGNKSKGSKASRGSRQSSTMSSRSGSSSGVKARRRRRRQVQLTEDEKDEEIDRLQAENNVLAEEVRKMSLQSTIDKMKAEQTEHEYEGLVKKLVRKGEDRHDALWKRCREMEEQVKEKDRIIEELRMRVKELEADRN